MAYHVLDEFRWLFEGKRYLPRDAATHAEWVAQHLYEDLYALRQSKLFRKRVEARERVLNVASRRPGVAARHGDGSLGARVPEGAAIIDAGFRVGRGPVSRVEIGVEVKVLEQAMGKQLDRVVRDLVGKAAQFRRGAGSPICIGIAGINQADRCFSHEGKHIIPTDGAKRKHPIQEAAEAEARLAADAAPRFDEFLFLRFRAINEAPYRFEWVDSARTAAEYGALLDRVSHAYETRFGG